MMFAKIFRDSTRLRGFLRLILLLTYRLSSNCPGVLGVSFQCELDIRNQSPLAAFKFLPSLLT
jgi:hypothetical protein